MKAYKVILCFPQMHTQNDSKNNNDNNNNDKSYTKEILQSELKIIFDIYGPKCAHILKLNFLIFISIIISFMICKSDLHPLKVMKSHCERTFIVFI